MVERIWSRRAVLTTGIGTAAAAVLGAAALVPGVGPLRDTISRRFEDDGPDGVIPTAAPGDERVESMKSEARRRKVDFYTAVPAGHGDGKGLPVCLVLHGASATAADYPEFGLGRFLSDATARGAPPFVLAGATGDLLRWEPHSGDDPQRMVHEEVPRWCAERGFDTTRLAVWGWSMGGYGSLLLAETFPGFVRAVAAFSPAVGRGDRVFSGTSGLRGTRVGLWCGQQDDLHGSVRALEAALPEPKAAGGYAPGRHTRRHWNRITPEAFDFLAAALTPG
jgi:pimeloyl-ACP methyl ester carboxylesterase